MSGFWKFTSSYASKVSKILENEDIILEDLLDERETVSELLASNSKLIEYLRRPEVLEKLIDYVVEDDEYQRKEIELDNKEREKIEKIEERFQKEKENIHNDIENDEFNSEPSSGNTVSSDINDNNNPTATQANEPENGKKTDNVLDENFPSTSNNKSNEVYDKSQEASATDKDATQEIDANDLEPVATTDEDVHVTERRVTDKSDNQMDSGSSDEEEEDDDDDHISDDSKNNEDHDGDNEEGDDSTDDSVDDDDDDDDDNDDYDNNEEETEVEKHTRRAQVAAEILSIDVWSITDAFMENVYLLQRLWCILDKPAPLPIFSATYFMKINEHLLDMKTDEMIQFIHQEPNLVERFMRHIETPPLMDFLLKVISTDKPDDSTGMIDTLKEQGLIRSLIDFLSPEIPSSIQSAAGDFLKAFITISANNAENTTIGPNELTRELVSEPMVRLLVQKMLQGGTALSNGVGIVIEIIRKNNSDYDPIPIVFVTIESHPPTPRDPIYLGALVRIFAESVPEFSKLLNKDVDKTLETPFGTIEPLGFERFKICELVAELIHCSNMALLNDPKGEEIIKDRDEIRELLIEKHKELMYKAETDSNASMDGADISKAIENLRLSKQKEGSTNGQQDTKNVNGDVDVDADETAVIDADDEDDVNQKEIVDDEPTLREAPLVGDQLKIALYDNKIIVTILDMFFKFPWNNFLHNVVFDIVQQILNATMEIGFNKYLAIDLFDRCQITRAIINGHNRCVEYEEETGLRLGYMGHLSLIAEEVVKFISLDIHHTTPKADKIDVAIEDEEWKFYVDETLADIRNKYNAVLGSDGKQMNEHDMNLFQRVYGTSEYDDEEEDEEDVIPESGDYMDSDRNEEDVDHDIGDEPVLNGHGDDGSDKFSRYIGEEITGDLHDKFGSSDDESEEDDHENANDRQNHLQDEDVDGIVDSQMGGHPYHEMSAGGLDDPIGIDDDIYDDDDVDLDSLEDDHSEKSFNKYDKFDDYEDPNDDGQSYVKNNHPLYQADGSLRATSNEKFNSDDDHSDSD